jgi:hypothetical protein
MVVSADILLLLAGAYLALGLFLGPWFIFRRLGFVDPALASAGMSLRFVLLFAAMGLWPIVLFASRRPAPGPTPAERRSDDRLARVHRLVWMVLAPASLAIILTGWAVSFSPLYASADDTRKAISP